MLNGTENYHSILHYGWIEQQFGRRTKHLFKAYNRNIITLTKIEGSVKFLTKCRKTGLTPRYIADKTKRLFAKSNHRSHDVFKKMKIITQINKKLLNYDIDQSRRNAHHQRKKQYHLRQQMNFACQSQFTVDDFINRQNQSRNAARRICPQKTNKNYEALWELNKPKMNFDSEWFVNLSSKEIPQDVE